MPNEEPAFSGLDNGFESVFDSFEDAVRAADIDNPLSKPAKLSVIQAQVEQLTFAERQKVEEFALKIDLHDTGFVAGYGAAAQRKSSAFSKTALQSVKADCLEEAGAALSEIATLIGGFRPLDGGFDQQKKSVGVWIGRKKQKAQESLADIQAKGIDLARTIDGIAQTLRGHRMTLIASIKELDGLYASNLQQFRELTFYIIAGKLKLAEQEAGELDDLKVKASKSGSPEDAAAADSFADQCHRFGIRLHDLELTRTVCIQLAPQIRLIQRNNFALANAIQNTITTAVPLWENQVFLALAIEKGKRAAKARSRAANITGELLIGGSETLNRGVIAAAKAAELGIVDVKTLEGANERLVEAIKGALEVQSEGRQSRVNAEGRMLSIEDELRDNNKAWVCT